MFLASDEVRMLEFGIVFLWLHQSSLLDVDNLPKAICKTKGRQLEKSLTGLNISLRKQDLAHKLPSLI